MKGSEEFRRIIEGYLWDLAMKDRLFMNKLGNENKSIDGCVSYILNTVMESGINGFSDDEVYSMAVHYYQEDDISNEKPLNNMRVVVNHHMELSQEEIEKLKRKARERCLAEEMARLKAPKKKSPVNQVPAVDDGLLFSFE